MDYELVPDPAIETFERTVQDWYEIAIERFEIPYINNYMVKDHDEFRYLDDLLLELGCYVYHSSKESFNPHEFPVNTDGFLDYQFDDASSAYIEAFDILENEFYIDMKKWMNHQRMFYKDMYRFDQGIWQQSKPVYHNIPISEVW